MLLVRWRGRPRPLDRGRRRHACDASHGWMSTAHRRARSTKSQLPRRRRTHRAARRLRWPWHAFVDGPARADEWSTPLARLKAPLGVHAILGNHDWWDDRTVQVVRAAGRRTARARARAASDIPVYENDAVRLTKDGRPFWLAGLGDQLAFWTSRRRYPGRRVGVDDLAGDARPRCMTASRSILLAHEPDIMPRVPERVSLVLSGHTHGGQVRLFGWSPVVPSRFGNRFAYGHVREQCDLIVSGRARLQHRAVPVRGPRRRSCW